MTYGAISRAPSMFGFIKFGQNFLAQGINGIEPGGEVIVMKADAAQTLQLGDVVYISDAGEVSKSATNALYALTAGVVVGGARTNYQAIVDDAAVGVLTVAGAGEDVLVQIAGVAAVKLAAGQTVVAPQIVGVGTTSGRVLTVAAGFGLGIALTDQATAAGVVYVLLRPSPALVSGGSVGGLTLNDLTDVTITATNVGDVLQYDNITSQWVDRPLAALLAVASATTGDVLTYDGTNWIAQAP